MVKENYSLCFRRQLKLIHPASDETICQILDTCSGRMELQVLRDIIRLVANIGLNSSELALLRIADVDFAARRMHVSRARPGTIDKRVLPLRPKTAAALLSLQAVNPRSVLLLGGKSQQKLYRESGKLKLICPDASKAEEILKSIRLNFVARLMSSRIPASIVKYCLGNCDQSSLLGHLSLTPEQKIEIVRRNLDNFVPEF